MRTTIYLRAAAGLVLTSLACGSSGSGKGPDAGAEADASPDPIDYASATAAMAAVAAEDPLCQGLGDFYWSVGSRDGRLGMGAIGSTYDESTRMPIFSASKWIFGAYVLEQGGGVLDASLIAGLNFTSGYAEDGLPLCVPTDTVGSCFENNFAELRAERVGTFHYASGHMQKLAAIDLGLFDMSEAQFASAIMDELGEDLELTFDVNVLDGAVAGPLAAGGMNTHPAAYESFLARMVDGQYQISSRLGDEAVATGNPAAQYSLGHWVELLGGVTEAYS
ncbi:MAG: hypothetical protein KJO07_01320, partial [Deltaproteobacteria bacterium]|nr:hypothetical protein [Deltaproteobacteria bacterium]